MSAVGCGSVYHVVMAASAVEGCSTPGNSAVHKSNTIGPGITVTIDVLACAVCSAGCQTSGGAADGIEASTRRLILTTVQSQEIPFHIAIDMTAGDRAVAGSTGYLQLSGPTAGMTDMAACRGRRSCRHTVTGTAGRLAGANP